MHNRRLITPAALLLTLLLAACNLNFSPDGVPETIAINGAPVVTLASPLPNATYLQGAGVNLQALVSNAGADIDRVEFIINDAIVATQPTPNTSAAASFSVTHTWLADTPGVVTANVVAFRADGTASAPATAQITIVEPGESLLDVTTAAPINTRPPVTRAAATATRTTAPTAEATAAPTTAAAGNATASFAESINVRRGPSLAFAPPIGSFLSGQTTDVLAVSTNGDWLKVRFGTGEGWIFAQLATVTGDLAGLPREAGPPAPTTRPPTTAPTIAAPIAVATNPPTTNANLVAGIVVLDPPAPRCNETFSIGFDVANLGSQATSAGGTVTVRDLRGADGAFQVETVGGFPVLQPNQTFRVDMRLTVATWFDEDHRLTLTIDGANAIPETNEGDNQPPPVTYRLDKAGCQ